MNDRNVVLTGLPRGGTTLSRYLVGKARNMVALNEHPREAFSLLCDSTQPALRTGIEEQPGQGRRPAGKLPKVLRMYDEELKRETDSMTGDIIEARLRTLSWSCERYGRYLPKDTSSATRTSWASGVRHSPPSPPPPVNWTSRREP
ncbi:MAG TPA: hypothetical protein VK359_00755 [Rubrobacteraceae bacterium]|nr:hypothetical protein [Rubrobacteraceae bacterium]